MNLLFSWFCFLQTALLFSAFAQDVSEEHQQEQTPEPPQEPSQEPPQEKPQEPARPQPFVPQDSESTTPKNSEKIFDIRHRYITHDEKPPIFGSHAFNPITQQFERVSAFDEAEAHNTSVLHNHSPHTTSTTVNAVDSSSTKGAARFGHYRAFKKLSSHTEETEKQLNSTGNGLSVFGNRTMDFNNPMNSNMQILSASVAPLNDNNV